MTQISPEQNRFLDQISDLICRYGLRLPALIALESGRPLAFLGGQALWVAQPALSLFVSGQTLRQMAGLLESSDAVAALAARLEAREV